MTIALKKYKKDYSYSYALGEFPTIELINSKPDKAIKVLVNSNYKGSKGQPDIYDFCKDKDIQTETNDKFFTRISPKENCYVIGIFEKYDLFLQEDKSHIVLVNPSNMGNMGTIIRTMVGFGINNLAIVSPGVDIFNPKVIRASMGAFFKLNFKYYNSFDEYKNSFPGHHIYTFMLNGASKIKDIKHNADQKFSLVFGNEAKGLDDSFLKEGTSVVIKHTDNIDSLNLPIAVGIAIYEFSKENIY